MKVELNNKLSSLLTSEVGSIIRKIITIGEDDLKTSAFNLARKYSGITRNRLLDFYSSFEMLEINDSGYVLVRTKGWKTPVYFKYYRGTAKLHIGRYSVLPDEVVWYLSRDVALGFECILRNQHPLSNESQL